MVQNPDDLLFLESLPFHLSSCWRTHISDGPVFGGQVTASAMVFRPELLHASPTRTAAERTASDVEILQIGRNMGHVY
jgi:hypothetical protein